MTEFKRKPKTADQRVLRPTGDLVKIKERIEANEADSNDFRVWHSYERYRFVGHILGEEWIDTGGAYPTVIDVASGYADNLAKGVLSVIPNAHIVTVDRDREVFEHNRANYGSFWHICDDMKDVSFSVPSKNYPVVVSCLETIGHVNIESDLSMLWKMKELAGDKGVCVVSIGRFEKGAKFKPHWYFERRYGVQTFAELMETAKFESVAFYGQMHPANRDVVICDNPFWLVDDDMDFGEANFMVGVGRP